jgi:hypothetical protein
VSLNGHKKTRRDCGGFYFGRECRDLKNSPLKYGKGFLQPLFACGRRYCLTAGLGGRRSEIETTFIG